MMARRERGDAEIFHFSSANDTNLRKWINTACTANER